MGCLPRADALKLFQEMVQGGGGLPLFMCQSMGGTPPPDWPPLVRTVDIEFDDPPPEEPKPVKKSGGGGGKRGPGVECPFCGWINFGRGGCDCADTMAMAGMDPSMMKGGCNPMAMMKGGCNPMA